MLYQFDGVLAAAHLVNFDGTLLLDCVKPIIMCDPCTTRGMISNAMRYCHIFIEIFNYSLQRFNNAN